MRTAEKARSTTKKPQKTFEDILNVIRESLSDNACSDNQDDGEEEEDEKEDTKIMNLARWWAHSPKWYSTTRRVFGRNRWRLTNWRNQDVGTWPTTSLREIWSTGRPNRKFRQFESPRETWLSAATPSPTTFGELMQTLDDIPGQSQMPQVTTWPGCSHMRLGSEKPQWQKYIASLLPNVVPN